MAHRFNITRDTRAKAVECRAAHINFDTGIVSMNLHSTTEVGTEASESISFDATEWAQAITDSTEDGDAFLASFQAILAQAAVTRFAN